MKRRQRPLPERWRPFIKEFEEARKRSFNPTVWGSLPGGDYNGVHYPTVMICEWKSGARLMVSVRFLLVLSAVIGWATGTILYEALKVVGT